MLFDDKPYSFDRVFRIFAGLAIAGGAIWLINCLSDVLIPFAVAFLMAYLLNPLVCRLQNKIRNRSLAVFLTLGMVIIIISGAGWLIIPVIRQEISHTSYLLQRVAQDTDFSHRASQYLPSWLWNYVLEFAKGDKSRHIQALFGQSDIFALLQAVGKNVMPGVWKVIHGAASFFVGLAGILIVMIYLVFMLLDYQRLKDEWKDLIPPGWRGVILEFIRDSNDGMNRYFRAQALIAFIVGLLFAAGFELIGLPLGILLGLFIGLLNMVPYLQIIGLIPAGLLAMIGAIETGGSLWAGMGLTMLVFAVVQIVQDAFLTPRIMGKAMGLSPAMILLSISVWGKLMGLLGLIIALPMTCLLIAYYRRMVASADQNKQ